MTENTPLAPPGKEALNDEIRRILARYKTVAVVGLSSDAGRDSYRVAAYLQQNGYRIVPINPGAAAILGETAYPDLAAVPFAVETVDIFRKPEAIAGIVDQAVSVGAKAVWMQLGLADAAAARRAREAGLGVVQDRCMKVEHEKLQAGPG